MKVIHYLGSLRFGGIEKLVYDLVKCQNRTKDLEVSLGVGDPSGEFKSLFDQLHVRTINFSLKSGFDLNPFKIINILKGFRKNDIIHLHGFHLAVGLAAILSRRPIIYTEHGNFGFGRKIDLSDKLSFFLRSLFFKQSQVTVCANSEFTRNIIDRKFFSGKRLHTVYNGIPLTKNIDKNLLGSLRKEYSKNFIIGTTSRLAGVKKIDRLITVFAAYVKRNKNAILLIIGDGPEKTTLKKMTFELGIQKNVSFLGYQKEISTFQALFDIMVVPSQNEAFGLVAVESLIQQKPVLVFKDGGGLCEIVKRFEPLDICSDSSNMLERLDYYASNGPEWIVKKEGELEFFSVERMEREYYNKYKQTKICVE